MYFISVMNILLILEIVLSFSLGEFDRAVQTGKFQSVSTQHSFSADYHFTSWPLLSQDTVSLNCTKTD